MCSSTQLTCGSQLWPPTTKSSVRTCTPIQDGEYAHNHSTSFRDFIPRNSSKQWNSRAPVVAQRPASHQNRRCSGCEPWSHPRPSPLSNFCELPSLVDLILILELLCLLHLQINFGLRQLPSSSGMAIQSDLSLAYTFKFFLRFCHADWR